MNPPETLKKTAQALVQGCRDDKERENVPKLYAQDAVSVEAYAGGGGKDREVRGIDAIQEKHDWWDQNFEELESDTVGPMLHGEDRFGVIFHLKTRHRESGEVQEMTEIGTYQVDGEGKIVREEFYYPAS